MRTSAPIFGLEQVADAAGRLMALVIGGPEPERDEVARRACALASALIVVGSQTGNRAYQRIADELVATTTTAPPDADALRDLTRQALQATFGRAPKRQRLRSVPVSTLVELESYRQLRVGLGEHVEVAFRRGGWRVADPQPRPQVRMFHELLLLHGGSVDHDQLQVGLDRARTLATEARDWIHMIVAPIAGSDPIVCADGRYRPVYRVVDRQEPGTELRCSCEQLYRPLICQLCGERIADRCHDCHLRERHPDLAL